MYEVIRHFHDLQDSTKTKGGTFYHEYNVGDTYPRNGFEVSDERLAELSGSDNKQGVPVIKLVADASGNRTDGNHAEIKPESVSTTKKTSKKTSEE